MVSGRCRLLADGALVREPRGTATRFRRRTGKGPEIVIHVTVYRVRPGKLDQLKAWFAEVSARADEVRETFVQEGVAHEQAFLMEADGGHQLVYAVECEDYDAARAVFSKSTLPIDVRHREIMPELTEGMLELTPLLDIRR
jgi:hypothetical protein